MRKHVHTSKHADVADEVQLLEANPMYTCVRREDGRERTFSLSDIAPCPQTPAPTQGNTANHWSNELPISDVWMSDFADTERVTEIPDNAPQS